MLRRMLGTDLSERARRIKTIDVMVSSQCLRSYAFVYSQDFVTSVSRLITVQESGRDTVLDANGAVTAGTALPGHIFTYSNNTFNVNYVAVQLYSSRYPAVVHENIALVSYLATHGTLPRLNKSLH